jgi:cell wall-associated NlpC family hydrolase
MPDAGSTHRPFKCSADGRVIIGCLSLILLLMVFGCASTPASKPEPEYVRAGGTGTEHILRAGIRPWLGTPHRLGGMSHRGIDCSGLVVILYEDLFAKQLPRTTAALIHSGRRVARGNLSASDLVFFKPGTKARHVGIYLGHGEFVHASTSHGVMISRMANDFWRGCYLTGRRLR